MKKLLFALVLMTAIFAVAGTMINHVTTYEITTDGSSNGLTIPSPFDIEFRALWVAGTDTTGLVFEVQADTYSDTAHTTIVLNDSLPSRQIFDIPETWKDSTFNDIIENFLEGRLNDIYGAENVTKQ